MPRTVRGLLCHRPRPAHRTVLDEPITMGGQSAKRNPPRPPRSTCLRAQLDTGMDAMPQREQPVAQRCTTAASAFGPSDAETAVAQ